MLAILARYAGLAGFLALATVPSTVAADAERVIAAYRVFEASYGSLPIGECDAELRRPFREAFEHLVEFETLARDIDDGPDLGEQRRFLTRILDGSPCRLGGGLSFRCGGDGPCNNSVEETFVYGPRLPAKVRLAGKQLEPATNAPPQRATRGMETNTDRPGMDIRGFDLAVNNPAACRRACQREPRCRAWTFVKPNTVQGPRPRCWLKHSVPQAGTNTCCVSGVARAAPAAQKSPPLARPRLMSPSAGATLANRGGPPWEFRWQAVPGATRYELIVAGSRARNPLVKKQMRQTTYVHQMRPGSYVASHHLKGWTWRVRAFRGDEAGPWSTGSFDVTPLR